MIQFHLSWFIYFSMDIVFTTRYLLYECHTILSTGSIVSSHNAKLASDAILLQFIYLFIYLLAIFMQADPVQLQAGLNGGLLRTY